MTSQKSNAKARGIINAAEKRLKAFTLPWNKEENMEKVAEMYAEAGGQFKIAKEYDDAGDSYCKSAELFEKLKNEHEACTAYVNAAKAYKNSNTKEAIRTYTIAAGFHIDANRFSTAGKVYKEIGILHEKDMNIPEAIKSYEEAANCFEAEDSTVTMNQMKLLVAKLSAQEKEYEKSIALYDKVIETSLESRMSSYAVKDYMFSASLCSFVIAATTGGVEGEEIKETEDLINRYKEMHPAFDGSREAKLLDNCLEAFKADKVEDFTDHVYSYDKISTFDNWTATLFLTIKTVLKGEETGQEKEITEEKKKEVLL